MMKLIFAFHNFAKARDKHNFKYISTIANVSGKQTASVQGDSKTHMDLRCTAVGNGV